MPDITMKRERTDRWTKMRLSRARSSGTAASCHMLSSVDCITTTSASEFSVHTGSKMTNITARLELLEARVWALEGMVDRLNTTASLRPQAEHALSVVSDAA